MDLSNHMTGALSIGSGVFLLILYRMFLRHILSFSRILMKLFFLIVIVAIVVGVVYLFCLN
jgi:hypothetical protein